MKQSIEFENLRDVPKGLPENKRPENVFVAGESILNREKTPAQLEITRTALKLVDEHLKQLGVELPLFDEKRIVFLPFSPIKERAVGMYSKSDFIFIYGSSEAELDTLIHELIHAQSSEWRKYKEDDLEEFLERDGKFSKTGFHRSENFQIINEGITEKVAIEILNKNLDEYARLKLLFSQRMEVTIAEQEKFFNEVIIPAIRKRNNENIAEEEKEIEKLRTKAASDIAEFDQKILQSVSEEETKALTEGKNDCKERLQRDIEEILKYSVTSFDHEQGARINFEKEMERTKEAYSFDPNSESKAYEFNTELIDVLVEGIARNGIKINSDSDLEKEKTRVWGELQRAYFLGQTFYLRKIDEAFGRGSLRKIDELPTYSSGQEGEDLEFLEEMKKKMREIV